MPHLKTPERDHQCAALQIIYGPYLCATTVSKILIVAFKAYPADSKVKCWIWESLEEAEAILQFVFPHIFVMHLLWLLLHSNVPRGQIKVGFGWKGMKHQADLVSACN